MINQHEAERGIYYIHATPASARSNVHTAVPLTEVDEGVLIVQHPVSGAGSPCRGYCPCRKLADIKVPFESKGATRGCASACSEDRHRCCQRPTTHHSHH